MNICQRCVICAVHREPTICSKCTQTNDDSKRCRYEQRERERKKRAFTLFSCIKCGWWTMIFLASHQLFPITTQNNRRQWNKTQNKKNIFKLKKKRLKKQTGEWCTSHTLTQTDVCCEKAQKNEMRCNWMFRLLLCLFHTVYRSIHRIYIKHLIISLQCRHHTKHFVSHFSLSFSFFVVFLFSFAHRF